MVEKIKRLHGIRKQCKRCYKQYNPKTESKLCPHDLRTDLPMGYYGW